LLLFSNYIPCVKQNLPLLFVADFCGYIMSVGACVCRPAEPINGFHGPSIKTFLEYSTSVISIPYIY